VTSARPVPCRAVRRTASRAALTAVAIVFGVFLVGACDFSESTRTTPADDLDENERPFAAPLGALYAEGIPDGVRQTFDAECLGAAYIIGFGLDALVVPGADAATLTPDDLVQDLPEDVDADEFVDAVAACGDVRVYAALIGGTRWAQQPLTAEQLRCAAGRMDGARAERLLRTSIAVEEGVGEATRDDAIREVVGHLAACGAPMTSLP
jgi:hypothetical protein